MADLGDCIQVVVDLGGICAGQAVLDFVGCVQVGQWQI